MPNHRCWPPLWLGIGLALISAMACHDETVAEDHSKTSKPSSGQNIAPMRAPDDRPNIVLFFVDDSGYGDYSHHGNPTIETPTISRLAQMGANFTQFYVTSPACSASRYSLLTGRYPARSGFGTWVLSPQHSKYLHPQELTLAEGLRRRGYATGIFGKWHLGSPNQKNQFNADSLPLAHGFDQWLGTNVSHDYADAKLIASARGCNDPISGYRTLGKNLRTNLAVAESLTQRYTKASVEFIREHRKQPFFAYIPHNQPHLGLHCSEAFRGRSKRGLLGDVMAEIDDSVAQILKTLDECGLAKNTLVIFSSDNGPWIRFQETATHKTYGEACLNIGYALPFRDGKGSTWEGGHRVPGIIYWPGMIPPQTIREPASTLDLLPTLFGICGVSSPQDRSLDGRDISCLLWSAAMGPNSDRATISDRTKSHPPALPPFEFIYSSGDNQSAAFRRGPWKIHHRLYSQTGNDYGFKASRKAPLLFQVEHDLQERFNRAAEYPKTQTSLSQRLVTLEKQIATEGTFWDH